MGQQPSRHVGSASRSLSGNEANKVVVNGFLPQNILVPSQQSLAFFSTGEPASVFEGTAGVVSGTDNFVGRRWNGKGGGRRWGSVFQVAGAVSSAKVLGPVSSDSGNMQSCSFAVQRLRLLEPRLSSATRSFVVHLLHLFGSETGPHDAQFCGVTVVPPAAETEFNGAQVRGAAASPSAIETDLENAPFDGAVASPSGFETELKDAQFGDAVSVPFRVKTELCDAQFPVYRAGAGKGDTCRLSRGVLVPQSQRKGRRAVSGFVAGFGQRARCERAEAGSCLDSDVLLSFRVENPSARVDTGQHCTP